MRVFGDLHFSCLGDTMKVETRLEQVEAQVGGEDIGSTDNSFPEFGCGLKGKRCGSWEGFLFWFFKVEKTV